MTVEFYHSDKYMDEIWKLNHVKKMAQFLITNENKYLTEWSNIIKKCTTIDSYINSSWKGWFKLDNRSDNKADQFISLVDGLYNLAIEGDFPDEEKRQKFLDKLRGGVLEVLTYELMQKRYKGVKCLMNRNCRVIINSFSIRVRNKNPQTIDIAGWDGINSKGEFYECKVWRERFDKKVIDYLKEVKREIDKISYSSIVGGISLDLQARVAGQFRKMRAQELTPIGRDNIKNKLYS